MNDLLDKIKRAARTIEALKITVLSMCDDMDAAKNIVDKEKIRLAIVDTEKLLDSAITTYNELVEETKKP